MHHNLGYKNTSYFSSSNESKKHVDGVAMGSPLGQALAYIFGVVLEVDGFEIDLMIPNLFSLDVMLMTRFAIDAYRKQTFSRICTNVKRFITGTNKIGLIMPLLFRCFSLCSNSTKFSHVVDEIDKFKSILYEQLGWQMH